VGVEGRMEVEQGRFLFFLVDVCVRLVTGVFGSECSPGAEFLLLRGGMSTVGCCTYSVYSEHGTERYADLGRIRCGLG